MNPYASIVMAYVLAALRVTPTVALLPSLGARSLPLSLRLAVTLALAVGIVPAVANAPTPTDPPWLIVAAVRELTVGTVLALVIAAPFIALAYAGTLLDATRSAGAATTRALGDGSMTSPLAALLQATGAVVFVSAGGHRGVVRALAASFDVVPLGEGIATNHLVGLAARWTAESLAAALTLGSAAWLALLAAEAMLAITVRFSPPIARAGLDVPMRVLVPLAAVAAAAGLWTDATQSLCARALAAAGAVGP